MMRLQDGDIYLLGVACTCSLVCLASILAEALEVVEEAVETIIATGAWLFELTPS
jgi:hypothetical protein